MKTGFLMRGLLAFAFTVLLFPLITFGETSPFTLNVTLLKDRVPAGELVPISVTFTIAPNHHIYKDQVKIESGDPARFTVASTELPPGKIRYDQFLEKEVEDYVGQVQVKSFLQVSKDIPTGSYAVKLKVHYQGCSDKVCFAPKAEEFILPVQVELTNLGLGVSKAQEAEKIPAVSKPGEKVESTGIQKTIESRGIFVSLIIIFLAGVGLSFTPCVYPMIPITVAVIGGQAAGDQTMARSPLKAFFLSLIYVLGISIVYSAMGELSTYRYYGHSLSDPRNEYRTREEEAAWRAVDPIERLRAQIVAAGVADEGGVAAVAARANERNARAAIRAAAATDPDPADLLVHLYTDTAADVVPESAREVRTFAAPPVATRDAAGTITYRDALREALVEEMARDARVVLYGEDVADYGGAFKLTKGLLETFGRARVFNTPISEAAICGTAVGAAIVGLRPVVELMYMDFALMASDQIANQAAKWHFMSGAQVEVPLVIRASVGAGKGYGGQHSQSLESLFTHTPGLVVLYPATPGDAKGLLKSAIRTNNPVLFVESQGLYGTRGVVPEGDHLTPIGQARIAREGTAVTLVGWGPAVPDLLAAADTLEAEHGMSAEVVDLRSLVPLDIETVLASVRRTGRCVVASQAVLTGSFVNEIVARIQLEAFDALDGPVGRIGAANGISPQAEGLERAFLPRPDDVVRAVLAIG